VILAYARTSTLKQAGPDKTTIAEQLAKCKAIASLRGQAGKYDFQTYTDAGVSGSTPLHERPGGKELLDAVKPGDIVIAAKMDRLFRSASDALSTIERFKKQKIGLILCDMSVEPVADSPAATMFFSMLAAFAQFERERIRERIADGKRAKRERGGHTGGPVPFGYRKIGEGPKAILVRNEAEEEHVRAARWFRDQARGRGPARIARLMADEGMLGRDGQPYTRLAVWRMLKRLPAQSHVPGQPDRLQMENVFNG
jgi:DNA invertase Pin-like site-specific DNA recombinase